MNSFDPVIRSDTPMLAQFFFEDNMEYVRNKSILFIGVRGGSMELKLVSKIRKAGNNNRIIVIEIFKACVNTCKEKRKEWRVIQGDGRFLPFKDNSIDIVTHIQGPEHYEEKDIIPSFEQYERIARELVLFECPNGFYKQGVMYKNKWEEHRSHLTEDFFKPLGYKTSIGGYKHEKLKHIFGYKTINENTKENTG